MLYKKYHRNFVKQFKIGAKFKFIHSNNLTEIVNAGPFYFKRSNHIEVQAGYIWWRLIYQNGKINKNLYVVQKIS